MQARARAWLKRTWDSIRPLVCEVEGPGKGVPQQWVRPRVYVVVAALAAFAVLVLVKDDAKRTATMQVIAGVIVFLGIANAERQIRELARQNDLTRTGQINDRFNKGIELLGDTARELSRVGAVYALESVARDSEELWGPVMETLAAAARGNPVPVVEDGRADAPLSAVNLAIATVLRRARRPVGYAVPIGLRRADLRGANLKGADLRGFDLSAADLSGADLRGALLGRTDLSRRHLPPAIHAEAVATGAVERTVEWSGRRMEVTTVPAATLSGVVLAGANLSRALLYAADLRRADLSAADLTRADLWGANLSGADLRDANLNDTNLTDATLAGTLLAGADVRGARFEHVDTRQVDLSHAKNVNLATHLPPEVVAEWVARRRKGAQQEMPGSDRPSERADSPPTEERA